MKKFILLTSLLILTRFADLQTTYFSTPDLKAELNPLVSKFGMGWSGLITFQVIFLAIIIYGIWGYCFKIVRVPPFEKRLSFKKFISLFYFNNVNSFSKVFYKLPANKNSFVYSFGYIITYTLIYSSILISGSTILLVANKSYRNFYISNSLWTYLYATEIVLAIFFSIRFFKKEFQMRAIP